MTKAGGSPWRRLAGWFGRHEALSAAWPLLLFTRLPVLLVGYVAVLTIGFAVPLDWQVSSDPLLNLLARWDTGWYLTIARDGYGWSGRTDIEQNIVFFPAYPLLMRAAGELLGGRLLLGGLAVSLASFLGAMAYMYGLARRQVDRETAVAALALLACYPYAVFYSAVYTESLFLLCMTGALYHFGRTEWLRAGGWGLLAGLARPNGFVLSLPLACMALAPLLSGVGPGLRWFVTGREDRAEGGVRRVLEGLAAAAMPGVGLLVFLAFNYWLTGDPFTWMRAVAAWGRSIPGAGPFAGALSVAPRTPQDMCNAAAVLFAAVMIIPVTWRFGAPYGLLTVVALAPSFLSGGLESIGRYTSVVFPLFLGLAAVTGPRARLALIIVFAVLQALAAVMFFTWRSMY